MSPVVRFAPSPTGFLHIGSARTALFNWLFAKHHKGKFLLRIEDTDRQRSTKEAVDAIFDSLNWLGIFSDEPEVMQSSRASRHAEVALHLLSQGKAYYCYCAPEELEAMKSEALSKGLPPKYNGMWRDKDPKQAPQDVKPVIRLKTPKDGVVIINDKVQGEVKVDNQQLDDMVLLRSDGTPTYMLSVVVDDHDMGITHVIRGDDHLTNTFRQYHIYKACGWDVPQFAHIPLIHGDDGAKLSKRHGALGTHNYKEMGFLPEALCNYLLRLGWGHGNDEIIRIEQAIEWFDLDGVGKSPSRFDMLKLLNLNAHYIRQKNDIELINLMKDIFSKNYSISLSKENEDVLFKGLKGLKERAKTLLELCENSLFYLQKPDYDKNLLKDLTIDEALNLINGCIKALETYNNNFSHDNLMDFFKLYATNHNLKLGKIAQALRFAFTGKNVSPSIFEIMEAFGKKKSVEKLQEFCIIFRN